MISPEQCRAARGWLGWSQEELATAAEVALSTVRDFERSEREPIVHNLTAIQRAMEDAGILFNSGTGQLSSITFDCRIKEVDTYIPILSLLEKEPDGFMKTSDLIVQLEHKMTLHKDDVVILENRSDTRFSQIVRNVVSHRTTPTNLIGAGFADYDKVKRGLRITPEGRAALRDPALRKKIGL